MKYSNETQSSKQQIIPDYILNSFLNFSDITEEDIPIFCVRVSSDTQFLKHNPFPQKKALNDATKLKGCKKYPRVFNHIGNGSDPSWLKEPAEIARRNGKRFLFFESVDRAIRNKDWKDDQLLLPTPKEVNNLLECTEGVRLVTLLPVNATLHDIRSHQIIRGLSKPKTRQEEWKARKEECYDRVMEIKKKCPDASSTLISQIILREKGFPLNRMLISRWIRGEK